MTFTFFLRLAPNGLATRYLQLTDFQGLSLAEAGDTENLFVQAQGYVQFLPWDSVESVLPVCPPAVPQIHTV